MTDYAHYDSGLSQRCQKLWRLAAKSVLSYTAHEMAHPSDIDIPCPRRRCMILLIVWDGLRPDMVSAERTPYLWRMAQSGTSSPCASISQSPARFIASTYFASPVM